MLALLAALVLQAPFPLPAVDGKPLAVSPGQRSFRLPLRFERVRAFYDAELAGQPDVTVRLEGTPGRRRLVLTSKRKGDSWTRAVAKEGELETVVDVVPVLRLEEEQVQGSAKPLVEFVLGRSPEVQKALQSIDHTGKQ